MRTILITTVAVAALVSPSRAEGDHSWWWYQKAKIACIGDVMRLCRSEFPDQDKVTSCMKGKKAQVSAGCAEFYEGGKNAD